MKYCLKKIVELIFIAIIMILISGTYWGMWGKISKSHNKLIIKSLLPWQKKELADAMNYYYNNNIAVKYTTGYLLRCKAETRSIERQFNWFYRNAISASATQMPAYHEVVSEAYRSVEKTTPDLSRLSTMEIELALAAKCRDSAFMTNKDISDLTLSTISLGVRIVAYSVNPILGASLTVISLINAGRSDITKAIPGIICFMQIRCRNFIYSAALLWICFSFMVFHFDRNRKKRKKKSTSKRGKKKRKKSRI